ncbi:MAG: putative two-component histidine kinase [Firmicutes bacterium]|nr:putative two-component histidine kinase [Bacillota bacterium]
MRQGVVQCMRVINMGRSFLLNALKTLIVIVLATTLSMVLEQHYQIGKESVMMVFLLCVLFSTVWTESWIQGIFASAICVVLFNYLFTEPRFTLAIHSSKDIVFLGFFIIAVIVSVLITVRLQRQIFLAAENERAAKTLYSIALGFLTVNGEDEICQKALRFIMDYTGVSSEIDITANAFPRGDLIYPIQLSSDNHGFIRVFSEQRQLKQKDDMIIHAVATQVGIAVHRERLRREQENIRFAMEKERQKSTLLRSVAHDLRSPLTALEGESNLLTENYGELTHEERQLLAGHMKEEIQWLTGLIENILDMTRITDGQLILNREPQPLDDLISEAVSHTKELLKGRKFSVTLPDHVAVIWADGRLIVQVLVNLLENAVRHTPEYTDIQLSAKVTDGSVEITVADTGEGIPEDMRKSIFERFVSVNHHVADGKRGLGLGLAICKTIVEAHDGRIWVQENNPHGAAFTVTLPLEA